MSSEFPIRAVVAERFDLGFILKHPNGRLGQLRVPEMSAATLALDCSAEPYAGLGVELDVYIVDEWQETYLYSEFSSVERQERERRRQLAIEARSQVAIGQRLTVAVLQKGDWGCICRDGEGLLEGIILSQSVLQKNGWSGKEMQMAAQTVGELSVGCRLDVVVTRKEWSDSQGSYILYFESSSR
jgi:hypothetical protein